MNLMGEVRGAASPPDRGIVVFSLDFELHWGVHDVATVDEWRDRLLGARRAIPRLLNLMEDYEIAATWAVVGMLFARGREELDALSPEVRPAYVNPRRSPYGVSVGEDEGSDPFHFAPSLIRQIADVPGQEIATHTFSHYYCLEEGQGKDAFEADLKSAIRAGCNLGIRPRSIVFPRNQVNRNYLDILADYGITSYRGVTPTWPYMAARERDTNTLGRRLGRLVDTYVPAFGRNCFTHGDVRTSETSGVYNIPASVLIRSYLPSKKALEPLRSWRIRSEIERAARHRRIVHLWTHPHNFGVHIDENINFIKEIFKTICKCRKEYGMISRSMSGVINDFVKCI
jgi:peptidoglycan/xylan/chitin deacetylase (PgdA/CDA1 family)